VALKYFNIGGLMGVIGFLDQFESGLGSQPGSLDPDLVWFISPISLHALRF
jgi:hypothetical protein